jgi:hypothetical protein
MYCGVLYLGSIFRNGCKNMVKDESKAQLRKRFNLQKYFYQRCGARAVRSRITLAVPQRDATPAPASTLVFNMNRFKK